MTRFLLVLLVAHLAALVVACGLDSPELTPAAAYAAGVEAIERGDAHRALALFEHAARDGHIDALRQLIGAYERGTLSASTRGGAQRVQVRRSRRRAERYRAQYAHVLGDSVRAGDPIALRQAAKDVLGPRLLFADREQVPEPIRESHWDPVDLDSARALYRLAARAPRPASVDLALIARALGNRAAFYRHLDQAIANGDAHACVLKVEAQHGLPDDGSAAERAAFADQMATCDPDRFSDPGSLGGVRQSAASDRARSGEALDSLGSLGLLVRYPPLAQR